MRVVAGTLGGRRLAAPAGPKDATRPTTELVRGAIFNSLTSLGVLEDAVVWDLFAGSGALGIEALSRGAAEAVFVDSDRRAVATIKANVEALGVGDRAKVVCGDVPLWLKTSGHADVALADPPYGFEGWEALLAAVRAEVVVCESDRELEPAAGWEVIRVRRHGGSVVTLMQPRGVPAA